MENLAIGAVLVLGSLGSLAGLRPRGGRQAWFVGIPFLEPFASVVVVAALMLGVLMIATYFTTIDDLGMLKHAR